MLDKNLTRAAPPSQHTAAHALTLARMASVSAAAPRTRVPDAYICVVAAKLAAYCIACFAGGPFARPHACSRRAAPRPADGCGCGGRYCRAQGRRAPDVLREERRRLAERDRQGERVAVYGLDVRAGAAQRAAALPRAPPPFRRRRPLPALPARSLAAIKEVDVDGASQKACVLIAPFPLLAQWRKASRP